MKLHEILEEARIPPKYMTRDDIIHEIRHLRDLIANTRNPKTLRKLNRKLKTFRELRHREAEEYHSKGGLGRIGDVTTG